VHSINSTVRKSTSFTCKHIITVQRSEQQQNQVDPRVYFILRCRINRVIFPMGIYEFRTLMFDADLLAQLYSVAIAKLNYSIGNFHEFTTREHNAENSCIGVTHNNQSQCSKCDAEITHMNYIRSSSIYLTLTVFSAL